MTELTHYWAKLGRREDGREQRGYHPLICHLIDVAAVTEALWDEVLAAPAREQIAAALALPPEEARAWTAFLAGLHDTGKACPAFTLRPEARPLWSLYGGRGGWTGQASDAPHGAVTARELPGILTEAFGVPRRVALRLAQITGGHHGIFFEPERLKGKSDALGGSRWQAARTALVQDLAARLGSRELLRRAPSAPDNPASMLLAGLITVADWIGSDEEHFGYAAETNGTLRLPLDTYAALARERAQTALHDGGWANWRQPAAPAALAELFPFITAPRPLQQLAEDVAAERPGIVVIEAPMGEGKTEAALLLADHWGVAPGPRGFYIALPTQATSNQMFGRVRDMLARRTAATGDTANLLLLHGHASLSTDMEELERAGRERFRPGDVYSEERPGQGGVAAAAWFLGRKRGLLAPFGAGTVDQALLAALQVKHGFVRLFGLAHRAVIIDEVHAYDAYMETLLVRLLEWLGALGSPVALLSATLPRARTAALVQAYLRGRGEAADVPPEPEPYPRITWASPGAAPRSRHIAGTRPMAPLSLEWVDGALPEDGAPFPLAQALREALASGGCAAVICSTVRRAQQMYRALAHHFPPEELSLFHARFLQEDRAARETRALTAFGKDGAHRPHRAVLVATQVIEQSLDLDFDLMVSDMAPADLLLQRAGRLHRHTRPRPPGLEQPRLWVCRPETVEGGVPRFSRADLAIYDSHVLLRSWLALRGRESLALPDDIEALIEAVYDGRPCPVGEPEAVRAAWAATGEEHTAFVKQQEEQAKMAYLPRPGADAALWEMVRQPREEDAPELHPAFQARTRLAPPSVTVAVLHATPAGPALGRDGPPLDLTARPDRQTARALLRRSVSLSDRRVVFALLAQAPPAGWARTAVTQGLRCLAVDARGAVAVPGTEWRLRLDPETGIEIVRAESDEQGDVEATE